MTDPRFPIGKFQAEPALPAEERERRIAILADGPARFAAAVEGLDDAQLDTPYRDGGWTVRQLVHHVPDSHMNAYVRTRLALTEQNPTIKPYEEALWAQLPDACSAPIDVSLALLNALHSRWVLLLGGLSEEQWKRTFRHPELGEMALDKMLQMYAWHMRHHTAHVTALRERKGWSA